MEGPYGRQLSMKHKKTTRTQSVADSTRKLVVKAGDHFQNIKEKATQSWNDSKPYQQKIKENLKEVGQKVADLGEGVSVGLREGIAEVQKKNKKRSTSI